jgi:spore maturation protein CgeB
VYRGWYKALKKQGHKVMPYNTNERLTFFGRAVFQDSEVPPCEHGRQPVRKALPDSEMVAQMATAGLTEACYIFEPDIVFFISAFYQAMSALRVIRRHGTKIVMLHTESPYQDSEQMKRGHLANLNLLNDPANLEKWGSLGVPAAYIPHSYDPDTHYPSLPRKYGIDFSFIGTAFWSRCEFFSKMDLDGIDTVFGGNGWDAIDPKFHGLYKYLGHKPDECVDNDEVARTYRMTKAGINFYRREGEEEHKGEGWAMGPREVEMAASGLFFLRDPRPESDVTFPMLPAFSGAEDAGQKLRWWLKHDKEREAAADKALETIQGWTFDNRARDAAQLMEGCGVL